MNMFALLGMKTDCSSSNDHQQLSRRYRHFNIEALLAAAVAKGGEGATYCKILRCMP